MSRPIRALGALLLTLPLASQLGCDDDGQGAPEAADARPDGAPATADMAPDPTPDAAPEPLEMRPAEEAYALAGTCMTLRSGAAGLRLDGEGFALVDDAAPTPLHMQASDLGTFLLYDPDGGYVVAEDGPLLRQTELDSDVYRFEDGWISGAEWIVEPSQAVDLRWQLRHRRTDRLMGIEGLVDAPADAVAVLFEPAEGCAAHPEMSLDAAGSVSRTHFDDGELFGFVDAHAHMLPNYGYGGGGIFHGSPWHRLGVEVAMGSCAPFHGEDGRADLLSLGAGGYELTVASLVPLLTSGRFPEPVHATDGWPTFSDWPTLDSATHQTMYYRWLERAWMAGLRLTVQHAVSNDALCSIMGETGFQPIRWSCRDMLNIDRQFTEIRNLERYIDAQWGGPGQGFLRVVTSPAEAREVIGQGKLAVVLGIEVPELFECYVTPREGDPECDRAHIEAQLDAYYERGLRVLFPTHKNDNAFSPGDGSKGVFEFANLVQTGHWSNFTDDCPEVETRYDKGEVNFGGLNMPRDAYLSPAPNAPIDFSPTPLADLAPYIGMVGDPPLEGDWCQAAGLTEQGRALMEGIMARGMLPELDHLPRRAYLTAFEMLEEADYPALATHYNTHGGRLWDIGGSSIQTMVRCPDPAEPGAMFDLFRAQSEARVAAGLHPGVGLGFDFNGLASITPPRFGPDAPCAEDGPEQQNPVQYPFTSFAGDVTFTAPYMGERAVDFNTEGVIHIGMVAELVEDARRTGVSDEDLEILFRSAEGYIQLWERAEARAAELRGQ